MKGSERLALLSAIAGDTSRAPHSMPGWYYNDPDMFQQEKAALFYAEWVCAGHNSSELASKGSYLTVTIGDEPVLVLRDREGRVRAYSNICRHRGMTLMTGKGAGGSPDMPLSRLELSP